MTQTVLFFTFAALSLLLSLAVVSTRSILRAAVFLTGVLFCSAAFYLMLHAEFLAGVQVLVYIGGIVVLLVFAIMLTSSLELQEDHPQASRRMLAALVSLAFFGLGAWTLIESDFPFVEQSTFLLGDAKQIGLSLLSSGSNGYVLPFEVISILLLAAVIGAIVVARKVDETVPEEAAAEALRLPQAGGHEERLPESPQESEEEPPLEVGS